MNPEKKVGSEREGNNAEYQRDLSQKGEKEGDGGKKVTSAYKRDSVEPRKRTKGRGKRGGKNVGHAQRPISKDSKAFCRCSF